MDTNQTTTVTEFVSLDDICKNFHLIIFLCIIFVLIVSANISVILQLSCSKKRHSRMSFFLLNLAYADLFVGIITVTRDIIEKSCIPFGLGSIGCKLTSFIQGTISYNSSYVLVCVSIDRLYAIIRPMDIRTASSTFRYSLIAASWVIAMTFASAQLYLRDIDWIRSMPICGNRPDVLNWNAYVYFLFVSLYLVPLIVMTVSYVIIIVIIWKKSSVNRKDETSNERNNKSKFYRILSFKRGTLGDANQIESTIRNARSLGVIPRAKIKTVKMTLVIVIAFTACWSPYFLLMIMNSLNLIQNYFLIRVTSSLCYMNSLANPLIYWLFATDFFIRCRQNSGCHLVPRKASEGTTNGVRYSLTESRYSIASSKHIQSRSNDDSRSQRTPRMQSNRQSNYRSPTPNQSRTNKYIVPQRNSQSSLFYSYQHRH
ncbi:unnamed protein product [Rotaria socialis]|nr:unnamed protein product [Rotaria socialis]CAF3700899.1 unnamed protein product [Rotaria socialis]